MQRTERAEKLADVAEALTNGDFRVAQEYAARDFPWSASESKRQNISPVRALKVFLRDRFIDRYSGSRLVFPGALLAIGQLLPRHFPMHPTWKASQSHEIFWELWPAVDHIQPVARGGIHDESNFATTSTTNNGAKGNALLAEIGWTLLAVPGPETRWHGLIPWFRRAIASHSELLADSKIKSWNDALRKVAL